MSSSKEQHSPRNLSSLLTEGNKSPSQNTPSSTNSKSTQTVSSSPDATLSDIFESPVILGAPGGEPTLHNLSLLPTSTSPTPSPAPQNPLSTIDTASYLAPSVMSNGSVDSIDLVLQQQAQLKKNAESSSNSSTKAGKKGKEQETDTIVVNDPSTWAQPKHMLLLPSKTTNTQPLASPFAPVLPIKIESKKDKKKEQKKLKKAAKMTKENNQIAEDLLISFQAAKNPSMDVSTSSSIFSNNVVSADTAGSGNTVATPTQSSTLALIPGTVQASQDPAQPQPPHNTESLFYRIQQQIAQQQQQQQPLTLVSENHCNNLQNVDDIDLGELDEMVLTAKKQRKAAKKAEKQAKKQAKETKLTLLKLQHGAQSKPRAIASQTPPLAPQQQTPVQSGNNNNDFMAQYNLSAQRFQQLGGAAAGDSDDDLTADGDDILTTTTIDGKNSKKVTIGKEPAYYNTITPNSVYNTTTNGNGACNQPLLGSGDDTMSTHSGNSVVGITSHHSSENVQAFLQQYGTFHKQQQQQQQQNGMSRKKMKKLQQQPPTNIDNLNLQSIYALFNSQQQDLFDTNSNLSDYNHTLLNDSDSSEDGEESDSDDGSTNDISLRDQRAMARQYAKLYQDLQKIGKTHYSSSSDQAALQQQIFQIVKSNYKKGGKKIPNTTGSTPALSTVGSTHTNLTQSTNATTNHNDDLNTMLDKLLYEANEYERLKAKEKQKGGFDKLSEDEKFELFLLERSQKANTLSMKENMIVNQQLSTILQQNKVKKNKKIQDKADDSGKTDDTSDSDSESDSEEDCDPDLVHPLTQADSIKLSKKEKKKLKIKQKKEQKKAVKLQQQSRSLQPGQIDITGFPDKQKINKFYEKELTKLQEELVKLQAWIKHKGLKVVVIFEGRDAAGKGGVIKRITERLNPRICRVCALGTPTEREKTQWYFQRYISQLPASGEMVLFDRSWYNRAGVERVMGFCSEEQYWEFMHSCPIFEEMLVRSGIILLKYWFSVSDEVQEKRFQDRMRDPTKRWKLSPMDIESRNRWVEYSNAKDDMIKFTDTELCGWYHVPADNKKLARLNCISHLLSSIPYGDLTPQTIVLPPREFSHVYVRPPVHTTNVIPSKYV